MTVEASENYKSGFVTIWGRPNVGKSTLLNRLVGEKVAIVTPSAQTTRNGISGICETEEGQLVLLEPPEILMPKQKLDL